MVETSAPPFSVVGKYDLRTFFRSVGRFSGERALNATPVERPEVENRIEMLDEGRQKITCAPLDIAGFVDGIQASLIVTHRAHRPVYLNYVAAGAIGPGARPLVVKEQMSVVCSQLDSDWLRELGTDIPLQELTATLPPDMEKDAVALLSSSRDSFERSVVEDLVETGQTPLVLDGSLISRPALRGLLGIVKSTHKKYLADESVLWGLPGGWRSPRFKIETKSPGALVGGADRYSCYLRLHNADHSAWNFGLIRLESFDPDLLDPLAARCLLERQAQGSGDHRYDRHLGAIAAVEQMLRARRPDVYSL